MTMRCLVAGFGNVGRALAEILLQRQRYRALGDLDVTVVGVTTATRGALANPAGVDLGRALAECAASGHWRSHPDVADLDTLAAVESLDFDVLVELSPLSVAGRGEPAITHVRSSLARGKDVVTANKGPIAWAWRDLSSLARSRGRRLLHEATVMDGAPVFNLARHCLRGNVVTRLDGILNATTNVVLTEMESGRTLDEAVRGAQLAGVAEADPSHDLDGWDAAVKLASLANVLMDADLAPEEVERDSLRGIPAAAIRAAPAHGLRVKLVCEVTREGTSVAARVAARELPLSHPFAAVEGSGSILRISTDLVGTVLIAEQEPDLATTAYGVIADLLELQGTPG